MIDVRSDRTRDREVSWRRLENDSALQPKVPDNEWIAAMLDESQGERHYPASNLLKDLIVVASAAGMLLSPDSPLRFAAFAGVALLFGAVSVWPRVGHRIRRWRARTRDERFALKEFPVFRDFVRRFGDFVDTRTNDTLHGIVRSELSEPVRAALARDFDPQSIQMWNRFWYFFDQRVGRQPPAFGELSPLIQEFNSLIGEYHNSCVAPVFSRLSDETRSLLSARERSKLNGFQHNYQSFTNSYIQFLRSLADSHRALQHLPRHLPATTPL